MPRTNVKGDAMMRFGLLFVSLFLGAASSTFAQATTSGISAGELKAHVKYLASDELEGRASGTEGNEKAAEYIADQFEKYGLKPGGDHGTYFQSFDFLSSVKLGEENALSILGDPLRGDGSRLTVDEDFRPFGFSAVDAVSGPLVFAGYGISSPDKNYDDYKDLDVKGKIVLILRYGPDGNDPHSDLFREAAFTSKARIARDKGAKGLMIVTGPLDEQDDGLVKLSLDRGFANSGIPAVSVRRSALEPYLAAQGKDFKSIQGEIKKTKKPVTFEFPGVTVKMKTDIVKITSRTANVVGYLEGGDPVLKDQVVVIGAHFDHLGYGGPGSGSLEPDVHAIHHGADDNASGTAGMLELAQEFSAGKDQTGRTFVFIGFSGEEIGTLGSGYYVSKPSFPLSQTVAMINLDEVGRLQNNTLTVSGTGTSSEWDALLRKYNVPGASLADTFKLQESSEGFGPSDHAQFYGKDVPVLFFFTGTHSDYHKPSDIWDKIDYAGQERIVRYVYTVAKEIGTQAQPPPFTKTASTSPMATGGDRAAFSVTLGIIPDYGGSSEGMKIGGIRPKGPAEKAGLKSGDVIMEMAGKKVLNIYDYMGILGELKAGDQVKVVVRRDGEDLTVNAVMEKRK